MTDVIATDQQRLAVGTVVDLVTIDPADGPAYRFVTGPVGGASPVYQGHTYAPRPIKIDGIKASGEGAIARPTLTISAIQREVAGQDLRGATVTRLRTLTRYLDGAAEADPTRHWPADRWRVEQLVSRDATEAVWRLVSALDFDRQKLPGRQVLRDVCRWRYRRWDGTAWDYSQAQCPYAGNRYFDASGNATADPTKDRCDRRISGCRLRFAAPAALPYGGFLGVARVRQ